MLGKLRDKYQSDTTTYKTHAMTTCCGGMGHTGKGRNLDSHIEDATGIDIGPDNDNESTNSSDTTLAFGGLEADGCLSHLLPSSQANFTILTKEINSLWQQVEAGEAQPVDGLDHTEWETECLSHAQSTTDFNPSTYRTFWRSNMPIHRHTMHHTVANKFDKFTTTGYCHLQWTQFNKIGGMVNRLRNSSWSHKWKLC